MSNWRSGTYKEHTLHHAGIDNFILTETKIISTGTTRVEQLNVMEDQQFHLTIKVWNRLTHVCETVSWLI